MNLRLAEIRDAAAAPQQLARDCELGPCTRCILRRAVPQKIGNPPQLIHAAAERHRPPTSSDQRKEFRRAKRSRTNDDRVRARLDQVRRAADVIVVPVTQNNAANSGGGINAEILEVLQRDGLPDIGVDA